MIYILLNYRNDIYSNFKNINDENTAGLFILLLYIIIPIIITE